MHTTPPEAMVLAGRVAQLVKDVTGVKVVLFPPAPYIFPINNLLRDGGEVNPSEDESSESHIEVGVQNLHWENQGAYTGEISAPMVLGLGARWAIIGHSERRKWFGETDYTVRRRAAQAIAAGIRPIVCIGETLSQRQSGATFDVLQSQVEASLSGLPLKGKGGLVIAYEPVWAIGTGINATPEQAQEAHAFVRQLIAKMVNPVIAEETAILYGGSVTAENGEDLLRCPDVDGALVGGASLKAETFATIVRIAQKVKYSSSNPPVH